MLDHCRPRLWRLTGRTDFRLALRRLTLRRRRNNASLRGARRMAAELAALALAERFRRRHVRRRRNRRGGALDGDRRNAPDIAFLVQFVAAHGHRALHAGGRAKDTRAHVIGMQRHVRAAGDKAWR
jgi:hypothetical protein